MSVATRSTDVKYGPGFGLGEFDPSDAAPPPQVMELMLSNESLQWQMKHSNEEFHYLSGFLPELFEQQGKA
jgi:hypothetical protein